MGLWYPPAERMQQPDNGSYTGGPPKGLLHSTEVPFGQGWAYYTGATRPHLEVIGVPATRTVRVRQFYPLDQPSRSLADGPDPVRTNRDSVVQIELGFRASLVDNVPDWFWAGLNPLLRWVEDNHGVDPDVWADFKAYPGSYGGSNGVRFSPSRWDAYNGWCGHMHAPENDHGDPGLIPVAKLRRGDWFDMATEAQLKAIVDSAVSKDNPSFMDAIRTAIEAERDECATAAATAVWDQVLVHPATSTTAKARTWLMYTNSKVDDLRGWLAGKLGQ